MNKIDSEIFKKAVKIKLVLADCDGVLTDTGTYYTAEGEAMKRFSIRDGMGVERLRKHVGVETGIITGEASDVVKARAKKLNITELHLGIKDKAGKFKEILRNNNLNADEIAFIGDDTNDIEIMKLAGLSACPADATKFAKEVADLIVESNGGFGAFRDLAEIIISSHNERD
ncbi:KdsC family phosphatase [Bacteroidota bacterium]